MKKGNNLLKLMLTTGGLLLGLNVFAQLSGTKTIDPLGSGVNNYTTFRAAFQALNAQGVGTGGVTFNVAAGVTFTEDLPVLYASGTAANPIVFQKLGLGSNPKVVPLTAGSKSPATINDDGDGIIKMAGGDYITFNGIDVEDNFSFTTTQSRYEFGYVLYRLNGANASQYVTIRNSRINMNRLDTFSIGLYQSSLDTLGNAITITATSGRCEYNNYGGLSITAYTGIYLRGHTSADYYDQFTRIGVIDPDTITAGGGNISAYGIYAIYQNELTIANTWVFAGSFNGFTHTSTLYGLYLSTGVNSSGVIRDNTVQVISASLTNEANGISSLMGAAGTNNRMVFRNNKVENCMMTASTSASFFGLRSTASASKIELVGNQVTGFRRSSSPSTGPSRMIEINNARDSFWVMDNVVDNDSSSASGEIKGIALTPASTCTGVVEGNLVDRLKGASGNVIGLELASASFRVQRNTIRRLQTYVSGATTVDVTGILCNLVSKTSTAVIFNNMISELSAPLASNTNAVFGIETSGNGSVHLFHNTVVLNASSSGVNFGSYALYGTINSGVNIQNNILVNNSTPSGTGRTVVIGRSGYLLSNYAQSCNNNLFYAGTPSASNLLYYDGTNAAMSIDQFRNISGMSGRESYSVQELPPFANIATSPYDLTISLITPTQVEGLGMPITYPFSINTDFSGSARGSVKVDAGAVEGNYTVSDNTGPGINFSPLANNTSVNRNIANVVIVDAAGIDVSTGTMPRLYYKKTTENNAYNGNTSADNGWKWVEANNTTSPFNFTTDYGLLTDPVVVGDTIQYFIVAQDINSTPNVGVNNAIFNAAPSSVDLNASHFPVSGVASYAIQNGISGTLLVGSGQTYTSLTRAGGAFSLINNSVVTGTLNIRITSDITNEDGAVALNEFAEEGAGGYRINIIPHTAGVKVISGSISGGLIRFNRVDRVTIDGRFAGSGRNLLFRNTATSSSAAIQLIGDAASNGNSADNIIIRNAIIEGGSMTTTTSYGLVLASGTLNTSPSGFGCHNAQITGNLFRRSYVGLYVSGTDIIGPVNGLIVANNTFGSANTDSLLSLNAISCNFTNGSQLYGNEIFGLRLTTSGVVCGIRMGNANNSARIYGNRIYSLTSTSTAGSSSALGLQFMSGDSAYIYNNLIYNVQSSNTSLTSLLAITAGMKIDGGSFHRIHYNSIHLYGTPATGASAAASTAFMITSAALEGLDLSNNIFANKMSRSTNSSKSYAIWLAGSTFDFSTANIDRNCYFVPAANTATTSYFVARYALSDLLNRAALRNVTGQDQHSHPYINTVAPFTADDNLSIPAATVTPAESQGVAIAQLGSPNKDFFGNNRPAGTGTAPDIGAIEFDGVSGLDFTAPVFDSVVFNASTQCNLSSRLVTAYMRDNVGGKGVDSVFLTYAYNGVTQSVINMTLNSGTPAAGAWVGTIPAAPNRNTQVSFYLHARDTAENYTGPTTDTGYTDATIIVTANPGVTINASRSATISASNNQGLTLTWTPGGMTGDTVNTGALYTNTTFYATASDGTCSHVDSVLVIVVTTPVQPVADFSVNSQSLVLSQTLELTDLSTNLADQWKWTITPATHTYINGTSDTSQHPRVRFTQDGTYTIKLVAANPGGADSITRTAYITVGLDYCNPLSIDASTHSLNAVSLLDLSNQNSGASVTGYEDYAISNPALTTTVNAGRTYSLRVENGPVNAATIAAWIDYNKNGSFESSEKLDELHAIAAGVDTQLVFSVPVNLIPGTSRLRVLASPVAHINLDACGADSLGETEDYLLTLCDVNDQPLAATAEICYGNTVLLDAGNPGASYLWNTGATGQTLLVANPGTYWVTVSTASCSATDTILVIGKPGFNGSDVIPAAGSAANHLGGTLATPDEVCVDANLMYEFQPPAAYGNAGYSSQWFFYLDDVTTVAGTLLQGNSGVTAPGTNGNALISMTGASADVDSVYMLRFHMVNLVSGCDSTIVRYVKVNGRPVADLGPDQSTCGTAAIVLDAGNAGSTYLWSDGSNAQTLNATTSGKYWVQITNASGCVSSDTVNLTFNQPVSFDLGADQTACTGNTVTLDAGVTGVDYLWSTGATTKTINVTTGGWYKLTVTTAAGCVSEDSVQVTFNAKPVATFTATQTGGSTFSFAPTTSGMTYLWRFGNGYLSSLANPVIDFQANGTYAVSLQVTDPVTGCVDSSSQTITLTTTGVNKETKAAAMINAYPNPFTEQATVEVFLTESAKVSLTVMDITGRILSIVDATELNSGTHQFRIAADGQTTGVYFVKVRVNGDERTIKLTSIR